MSKKNLYTTREQIRDYWGEYAHLFPAFYSDPWEMHDVHTLENGETGICWACGWFAQLERCHLVPRNAGGSDDPSNLHLLCSECHKRSEGMDHDAYAYWLASWTARLRNNDESFAYHAPRTAELMTHAWIDAAAGA